MLHITNYHKPADLEEAYTLLQSSAGAALLAGCGYLRLGTRRIENAIDLASLGLDTIVKEKDLVSIAAMVPLRQLETNPDTAAIGGGILKHSVENIVGVQLRNCVTLGGSVAGRYPFSDPITALVAMDTELEFYKAGRLTLTDFLAEKAFKDILLRVLVPHGDDRLAVFKSIRKSATDYAVLNVAVAQKGPLYRVAVGSRPGKAMRVPEAEAYLAAEGLHEASCVEAGKIAASHLRFGDNPRGSAEYRRAVCPVLIRRALQEVLTKAEEADAS